MPLVVCPDCQTKVSDAATACPSCGRPMRAQPQQVQRVKGTVATWRIGGLFELAGFLGILVGGGLCFGGTEGRILAGAGTIVVSFVVFIIGRFF